MNRRSKSTTVAASVVSIWVGLSVVACSGEPGEPGPVDWNSSPDTGTDTGDNVTTEKSDGALAGADEKPINSAVHEGLQNISWEEFKESATHLDRDGNIYYLVEGDIPILTEPELRTYYDARVRGVATKGVLHTLGLGIDDVWLNGDQLHLRYCVDTDPNTGFGATISGVVGVSAADMIAAAEEGARAWEQVANVQFEYDSANNDNCGRTDPIPDARYIKVSRDDAQQGACAFGPQSKGNWTCPGLDGNTIGVKGNYIPATAPPGVTWPGTMMHELGHTLGLHHEQLHTNGGGCSGANTRDLTANVDLLSIMGYSLGSSGCALTTPNRTALSSGDGISARMLYGMPAAWYMTFL